MADARPHITRRLSDIAHNINPRACICWVGSIFETEVALSLACAFTKPEPCRVVMGLDSPFRVMGDGQRSPRRKAPLTPSIIRTAESRLGNLYGHRARCMVLPGHPVQEIRRYARTQNIELIVMGEQAMAIEAEYGERLIDKPPCAVLLFVDPKGSTAPKSES